MIDLLKCIDFTNENKICYLATVDKDQPHVRGLLHWFADETGFYFEIGGGKNLHNQLLANPKTEVCFYRHEGMVGTMLRITGSIEFLDDIDLREKLLNDRPFLKDFGMTKESKNLIMFRIPHGKAQFWTWDTAMKPAEILEF